MTEDLADGELLKSNCKLGSLIILSGMVHTGVKVRKMDSELCRLVDISIIEDGIPGWLQYRCKMCCKKDGYHERRACIIGDNITVGM